MFKFFRDNRKVAIALTLAFALMLGGAGLAGAFLQRDGVQSELTPYTSVESAPESSADSRPEELSEPEISEQPEQSEQSEEDEPFRPVVKKDAPDTMRAVMLTPGEDFLAGELTQKAVRDEVDAAIASAKKLKMNTLIVELNYLGHVIYRSSYLSGVSLDFDVFDYILTGAREAGMYVYAVFDVLNTQSNGTVVQAQAVSSSVLDLTFENTKEFAGKYSVDGIILDGYLNSTAEQSQSYSAYLSCGGGMGFTNYRYDAAYSVLQRALDGIAAADPSVNVGILTEPVWANSSTNAEGSETSAEFEMMYDACADVRKYISEGMFDFVAVRASGSLTDPEIPFLKVMSWWSKLAREADIPLYAIQFSDNVGSKARKGWEKNDQLAQQLVEAKELEAFSGSIFNSLTSLVSNKKSTEKLLEFFDSGKVSEEFILKELEISKPQKKTFETSDKTITFNGASDPSEEVLVNGERVKRDVNGAFSLTMELSPGLNEFTFTHRGKTISYKITRSIVIIKDIQPTGNITVDGGMKIEVSAIAYEDSIVTATLNGQSITLTPEETQEDESLRDTTYVKYTGVFTAPAAGSAQKSLGNIVIKAKNAGQVDTKQGAAVTVNKKAVIVEGDGNVVEVVADYCETYPANTLDSSHEPSCYPLAKGTRDYVSGDPVVYKDGSKTYTYYVLQSGQRVAASDVVKLDRSASLGGNAIKSLTVASDARFTRVILDTEQPVAYKFNYGKNGVTIDFKYTESVPESLNRLTQNPLFSAATWSGTTLTLSFNTANGFLGYTAYYESGKLVFRFTNPSAAGIAGSVIVIDPGHSSVDPGALGFLDDYPEQVINQMVCKKLKQELSYRGANVYMIDTQGGKTSLETRVSYASSVSPQVFVSVHCNSASNANATGTEAWYYNAFSASLARKVSAHVSASYSVHNRGGKYGYFYVTRYPMFPATLAELGFVTNNSDYYRLLREDVQYAISSAIADAIAEYLSSVCYGYAGRTGTESTAGGQQYQEPQSSQESQQSQSSQQSQTETQLEGIEIDYSELSMRAGDSVRLVATLRPDPTLDVPVVWSSSAPDVVGVAQDGTLTAYKEGEATVTVTAMQGGIAFTAKCTVSVSAKK